MNTPRAIRLITLAFVIGAAVAVAGCTRSKSEDVAPTTPPGGDSVDVTMQAVLSGTQTAQALLVPGSGGGLEFTPTPITLAPTVVVPTVTPLPTSTPVPTSTPAATTYTVKQGDWLYKIARDLNVSVEALLAANPGINPNLLQPGQVLNMPQPGATPGVSTGGGSGPTTYTVQQGEWIYQIARKLGKDPKAIIAANPGINPNNVQPGQVLNIP